MKKWLKKTAAAGLAALLLASLAGCGNDAKKAEEGKAAGYPVRDCMTVADMSEKILASGR